MCPTDGAVGARQGSADNASQTHRITTPSGVPGTCGLAAGSTADPCHSTTTKGRTPMTQTDAGQSADLDANELAQGELAANTVPTPDDLLADVGPLAVLWYAREVGYYAVRFWSATLADDAASDVGDTSELAQALEAIAMAAGNLDGACVAASLLPADYADGAPA